MPRIKLPPKLPFKKLGLAGLGLIGGSLAMENRIPLLVFNLAGPDNIRRAIKGEEVGTIVS